MRCAVKYDWTEYYGTEIVDFSTLVFFYTLEESTHCFSNIASNLCLHSFNLNCILYASIYCIWRAFTRAKCLLAMTYFSKEKSFTFRFRDKYLWADNASDTSDIALVWLKTDTVKWARIVAVTKLRQKVSLGIGQRGLDAKMSFVKNNAAHDSNRRRPRQPKLTLRNNEALNKPLYRARKADFNRPWWPIARLYIF